MLAAEQAFWQMERAAQFKYASLNVSKNRNSKRLSHPAPPQTSAVPTRAAVPIPRALPWIDIGISEVDENFKKTKGMTTKKKNAGRARIRTGEDGFIDSVKDANVGASDANLNASTYDDDDEEEDDDESTPPAQNIKGMLGFQPLRDSTMESNVVIRDSTSTKRSTDRNFAQSLNQRDIRFYDLAPQSEDWDYNLNKPPANPKKKPTRRRLIKTQQVSVDRLARSKWRRDPIKERLLFLTGTAEHRVEDAGYVSHLDMILQEKHHEMERDRIAQLMTMERDREWLWSVKYDLDFTEMEKATVERHRAERKVADDHAMGRQDAMFSSAGKQIFYTVATRTYGLDKMRNVDKLREMHQDIIDESIQKGIANPRCTWQLHALENLDEELGEALGAKSTEELYLASEAIIEDCATLEEQRQYGLD